MAENEHPEEHEDRVTALLRRVAALVSENHLAELIVEDAGLKIHVKGMTAESPIPPTVVQMHPQALPPSHASAYSQAPGPAPAASPKSGNRVAQESPMVGVFYCAATPEDPAFVNVGDIIAIGQTIGLIEAMKVYSELPSEVAGRVVEIAVQNGKLVQQGQPILYVEPA